MKKPSKLSENHLNMSCQCAISPFFFFFEYLINSSNDFYYCSVCSLKGTAASSKTLFTKIEGMLFYFLKPLGHRILAPCYNPRIYPYASKDPWTEV